MHFEISAKKISIFSEEVVHIPVQYYKLYGYIMLAFF